MTSKERVRLTAQHKKTDRVPADFNCVSTVMKRLIKDLNVNNAEDVYQLFDIDIRTTDAKYIGPELPQRTLSNGNLATTSYWGYESEHHVFEVSQYTTTITFPFNDETTLEDVEKFNWPKTEWFDYSTITEVCEKYPDKAIGVGWPGAFQMVTNLMKMDEFFILMLEEPEIAHSILDHMVDFELEHYEKMFIAGKGKVDILRVCDDYGTQISMLFSVDLWKEFFQKNQKRLVDLCHKYGVFFEQHSCGAIEPLIPYFIENGVDILNPIQPVTGLSVEILNEKYNTNQSNRIVFNGGIDTQDLLPNGTPQQVLDETNKYIKLLKGSYILMASQAFEDDVPTENVKAVYSADRTI